MPTFLAPIDLSKNELRNARIQNLASAPGSPVPGQIYYDSALNKLYWWNGSSWVAAEPGTPTLDFAETADMVGSSPGDTADGGVGIEISRADHRHARTDAYAAVAQLADVDAAAENAGASTTISRGDHKHALSVGTPVASAVGDTVADGTANTAARSDHRHPREAFGNVSAQTSFGASSNNGSLATISRSDHAHGTPTHDSAAHSGVALSSLSVPVASVAFNNQKITGLGTPTADTDAATKGYVDSVAAGIAWKDTVRAATTAAGTLATGFENTDVIDGVTLATGDRILIKNQAAPAENGIYTVNASGAPTRATDADSASDILNAAVFIQEGTVNADTGWVMTTNAPITLGTTGLTFVQFTGAASFTAGAGLTQTGNTIDVVAGTGIVVNANDVQVNRTGTNGAHVPLKHAQAIGDGAATSIAVTHNLGTVDVIVQVFQASGGAEVEVDVTRTSTTQVTLGFAVAPASNALRVVVLG
jgi:hypothetical protein